MSAVPVTALAAPPCRACPKCGRRATWQVGPDLRACDEDLARSLRQAISRADGFIPPLVTLLPTGGVA